MKKEKEIKENTEPIALTEPLQPSESSEPSQPSESSELSEPSEPSELSEPSESSQPSEPSQPSESSEPSEFSQPSESSELSEPSEPSEASEPLSLSAESLSRIEGFRAGGGFKKEQIERAVQTLLGIAADGSKGVITEESLRLAINALGFDEAVEKARAEGEIAGRNATIEERFMKPADSDGVPSLGGSSAAAGSRRPDTIFDLAGFAR